MRVQRKIELTVGAKGEIYTTDEVRREKCKVQGEREPFLDTTYALPLFLLGFYASLST